MRTSSVVDGHPELPGQALEGDGEVQVALTAELGLVDLVVAADHQRGVVLDEPVQGGGQLVLVGGVDGRDRHPVDGVGHRRGRHGDRGALRGEGVAGDRVAQLGDGGDVAGGDLGHLDVLLAAQGEEAVEALVGTAAGVHQVVVGAHGARQHPEQGDLADEGVGDGAEDLHQGLAGGVGDHGRWWCRRPRPPRRGGRGGRGRSRR